MAAELIRQSFNSAIRRGSTELKNLVMEDDGATTIVALPNKVVPETQEPQENPPPPLLKNRTSRSLC